MLCEAVYPTPMASLAQLKESVQTNLRLGKYMEVAKLVSGVKPKEVQDADAAAALLQVLALCVDNRCCALERSVQTAVIDQIRGLVQLHADDRTYFDAVILSNRVHLLQGTVPRTFSFQGKKMSLEQFKTFACQHGQFQANENPLVALELMRAAFRLGNADEADLLCGLAIFCGRADVLRELEKKVDNAFVNLVLKKQFAEYENRLHEQRIDLCMRNLYQFYARGLLLIMRLKMDANEDLGEIPEQFRANASQKLSRVVCGQSVQSWIGLAKPAPIDLEAIDKWTQLLVPPDLAKVQQQCK